MKRQILKMAAQPKAVREVTNKIKNERQSAKNVGLGGGIIGSILLPTALTFRSRDPTFSEISIAAVTGAVLGGLTMAKTHKFMTGIEAEYLLDLKYKIKEAYYSSVNDSVHSQLRTLINNAIGVRVNPKTGKVIIPTKIPDSFLLTGFRGSLVAQNKKPFFRGSFPIRDIISSPKKIRVNSKV